MLWLTPLSSSRRMEAGIDELVKRPAKGLGGREMMGARVFSTHRKTRKLALIAVVAGMFLAAFAPPASAGVAKKLAFLQSPAANTPAGVAFAVTVQTQDAQSRPTAVTPAPTITLSLPASGGCAAGSHTLYVISSSVVNTTDQSFTLKINPAGSSCKLTAATPGLTSGVSSTFAVTGFACPVTSIGGSCSDDPNHNGATTQNPETTIASLTSCTAASGTTFLTVDDENHTFAGTCNGTCDGTVLVAWDCAPSSNSTVLITITLDKSQLPPPGPDKGAPHIAWYKEGFGLIPDCTKAGILDPGPVCVSAQYSNSGDRITEILSSPDDSKYAH